MIEKNDYFDEYMELATHCYLVIMCYEKYLLDEMDHQKLAEVMKELLESLPDIILDPDRLFKDPEKP